MLTMGRAQFLNLDYSDSTTENLREKLGEMRSELGDHKKRHNLFFKGCQYMDEKGYRLVSISRSQNLAYQEFFFIKED